MSERLHAFTKSSLPSLCRALGVDAAPALVGFEIQAGRSVPLIDGVVVCQVCFYGTGHRAIPNLRTCVSGLFSDLLFLSPLLFVPLMDGVLVCQPKIFKDLEPLSQKTEEYLKGGN